MSKIIFLNGCGSSGKTTIARSIQNSSYEDWITFGVDTFIEMLPNQKDNDQYYRLISGKNERGPTMHVETGPKGKQLFGIMPEFAKLLADNDNNLIIDEVLLDENTLKSYTQALKGHLVYFIAVMCDLTIMQERELSRGDRAIGLSNDQIDRAHSGLRDYDLTIDTSQLRPFEIATQIIQFVNENPIPKGFIKMRNELT